MESRHTRHQSDKTACMFNGVTTRTRGLQAMHLLGVFLIINHKGNFWWSVKSSDAHFMEEDGNGRGRIRCIS